MLIQSIPFSEALDAYVQTIQAMNDRYFSIHYPSNEKPVIKTETGSKNVRIVKSASGSNSVHSFVNIETGDILKGSWKSPVANGKRGNIFDPDYIKCIDHHGPKYLR